MAGMLELDAQLTRNDQWRRVLGALEDAGQQGWHKDDVALLEYRVVSDHMEGFVGEWADNVEVECDLWFCAHFAMQTVTDKGLYGIFLTSMKRRKGCSETCCVLLPAADSEHLGVCFTMVMMEFQACRVSQGGASLKQQPRQWQYGKAPLELPGRSSCH